MGADCNCGRCNCNDGEKTENNSAEDPSSTEVIAVKKVEKLKESIKELGFKVEETPEGIKISE